MGTAFDLACEQLQDTGQSDIVKEVLARRIIELANSGVTDPVQLCKHAVSALASR
jgi:hypothetical protein